jgi:hypothetical protein
MTAVTRTLSEMRLILTPRVLVGQITLLDPFRRNHSGKITRVEVPCILPLGVFFHSPSVERNCEHLICLGDTVAPLLTGLGRICA